MSDVITFYDSCKDYNTVSLEKEGRDLYQSNKNLRNIMNVMEHPEFQEFFNNYFQDWDITRVVIMFMKIYNSMDTKNLSGYQKIALLKNLMDDGKTRQRMTGNIMNHMAITDSEKSK
jgi:hypothetical protein